MTDDSGCGRCINGRISILDETTGERDEEFCPVCRPEDRDPNEISAHNLAAKDAELSALRSQLAALEMDAALGRNFRALVETGYAIDTFKPLETEPFVYLVNVNHRACEEFETLDAAIAAAKENA